MNTKKFTACIYLYHGHAVTNLKDMTIVDTDPVRLAAYYSEHNVDGLIVFDMSESDTEHEEALDIIKEICNCVGTEVYGAGNVHRMEDIKKLLYAGCKKAVLFRIRHGRSYISMMSRRTWCCRLRARTI